MIKKHTIILMAAVAGAMTVFATVPQLKITVGEETVTLYPGEEMNFGATDGVTEGVNKVAVNGNAMDLGASAKAEYRHSDAAPKVNGVALNQVQDTPNYGGVVALTKGEKVFFDGIGRAGNALNKNLRNWFTVSEDGEYAIFNGNTDNYSVTIDTENLVGHIGYASVITIDGVAIDSPFAEGYSGQYEGKEIPLTKGQKVTFEGVRDLKKSLQLHFWDVTSDTEATFLGKDGSYDLIWDKSTGLFFTELHGWLGYPDMLYVGGANWGHSGANGVTAPAGWQNDQMKGMLNLNNIEGGKWQVSMYLADDFAFKFACNHWMDATNQYDCKEIDTLTPDLIGGNAQWGDFIPGTNFTPGVYMITIDLDLKTLSAEKLTVTEKDPAVYKINGVEMTNEGAVRHATIDLAVGQSVSFENFPNLAKALQPDFWEVIDANNAKFTGIGGTYEIFYDEMGGIAYTLSYGMNFNDGTAVWLNGNCWGHPGAAPVVTSTGWDFSYNTCLQMKKVEDGVYETTVYFPANFCAKFYKARDWNQQASTDILTPQPSNMFTKNEYGDFLPGSEFKAGTYTIRVDYNRNIVYAVGYYTPAE